MCPPAIRRPPTHQTTLPLDGSGLVRLEARRSRVLNEASRALLADSVVGVVLQDHVPRAAAVLAVTCLLPPLPLLLLVIALGPGTAVATATNAAALGPAVPRRSLSPPFDLRPARGAPEWGSPRHRWPVPGWGRSPCPRTAPPPSPGLRLRWAAAPIHIQWRSLGSAHLFP